MRFSIKNIKSDGQGNFQTQLQNGAQQIQQLASVLTEKERIVKVTLFLESLDQQDYLQKADEVLRHPGLIALCDCPLSVVSQSPMDSGIAMEIWILNYSDTNCTFSCRRTPQSCSLRIENNNSSYLLTTHYCSIEDNIRQNIENGFLLLDQTLRQEGFGFQNIVRKWNYIENITRITIQQGHQLQNYQIFNDIRASYYQNTVFQYGYPSATGIGMSHGGFIVDVIAIKGGEGETILPVTNIRQIDAHSYSEKVLVKDNVNQLLGAATPKFERGKFVSHFNGGFIFVSGTAAIAGENTIHEKSAINQTSATLEIIDHLISSENLTTQNIELSGNFTLLNYRVYVKNRCDLETVKRLCVNYFNSENGILVCCDVCRENLLVEIEVNYETSSDVSSRLL